MNFRFTSVMAASLLGTTALISTAAAQTATETMAADPQACESLRVLNDENAETFNEEFVIGARDVIEANDPVVCGPWLAEAESALEESEGADLSATGGRIVVTQPEPNVVVDQADPRVSVTQEDPTVNVQQGQPEIIVRQQQPTIRVQMPRPTITIDQPQPQIIVRMPDPDVAVSTPEPQVSVSQAQPDVSVTQPQPQVGVEEPTVNLESQDEANIAIEEGQPIVTQEGTGTAAVNIEDAQPMVSYEEAEPIVEFEDAGEPELQYNQTGEADIQFEDMDEQAAAQQGAVVAEDDQYASLRTTGEPVAAGAASTVVVSDIVGRDVVNLQGEELGEIESVTLVNDRAYAILAEGGFLGIGEDEVAVPLDSMSMRGDEIVLRGMTEEDIDAMPEFDATMGTEYGVDDEIEFNTL